ncbi:MAG: ATP-binding protein [Planctomycetota bacterium]
MSEPTTRTTSEACHGNGRLHPNLAPGLADAPSEAPSQPLVRVDAPRPLWHGWPIVGALGLLCACAALFVSLDVVERVYFPGLSTGWRHFLLTICSALVTVGGCTITYLVMLRQQQRIESTAELLSRRLEAYCTNAGERAQFQNPYRVDLGDIVECPQSGLPVADGTGQPCWQRLALSGSTWEGRSPQVTIQQCHECPVYRRSCPDGLTRLGESFNSLMFMLGAEAEKVRRMHAQMAEKEKMVAVGQLAAGIAHEIGNPLSSISSIVQMVKRQQSSGIDPSQLDLIQRHIQRISETVRQMGAIARPVAERWELADLGATLEEAVALVSFDGRAKTSRIELQRLDSLPKTYALRGQLQQVFINLLLNALDAMPEGGTLAVSARAHGRSTVFSVADTGCGIPREVGRRVFEPFFTTKEQGKGTGLGLAVSYGIVQKHGGSIDFHPRDGGGTVFTVEIPILLKAPDA